jgi:hypothetical protein
MKIYVASSWRNTYQPEVVQKLRAMGHQVYDFRGIGDGWGGEKTCEDCRLAVSEHKYPNSGPCGGFFEHCPVHRGCSGFGWKEVDPDWQNWPADVERYRRGLDHPRAIEGFNRDMDALKACDACLMVMPCGPSASMEMGWAVGAKKLVAVYMPAIREPDLMVRMAEVVTTQWDCIELWLKVDL